MSGRDLVQLLHKQPRPGCRMRLLLAWALPVTLPEPHHRTAARGCGYGVYGRCEHPTGDAALDRLLVAPAC